MTEKNYKNSVTYFRSARAGLTAILDSFSIGYEDEIILSAFTCDAVTKAIEPFGSEIILYDCDENLKSLDGPLLLKKSFV